MKALGCGCLSADREQAREKGVRIGQRMFVRIRSTANRNYVGNFYVVRCA